MTKSESKRLTVGSQVMFTDGSIGTVTSTNQFGVEIDWEDGQIGGIFHEDMQDCSRLTKGAGTGHAREDKPAT